MNESTCAFCLTEIPVEDVAYRLEPADPADTGWTPPVCEHDAEIRDFVGIEVVR